ETNKCPNVPGFFYRDDCRLLCQRAKWTDVVVFFFSNYVAHAGTITTRPGQSDFVTMVTMIVAVLFPGSGLWNGLMAIFSFAAFAPTDLQKAARAGALYAVIRKDQTHENNESTSCSNCNLDVPVSSDAVGVNDPPLTDENTHRPPDEENQRRKAFVPSCKQCNTSWVSTKSNFIAGKTRLLTSTIHGVCRLPNGYCLMQVPSNAEFEENRGPDCLPPQSLKPTIRLSCSYNLLGAIAAVVQLVFAISTLYRARGDQIERYGYAAFGLTVVPYAWMSLINLLGNFLCPKYDTIYVVESRALHTLREDFRKAQAQARNSQCTPACQEGKMSKLYHCVEGTVGHLTTETENKLYEEFYEIFEPINHKDQCSSALRSYSKDGKAILTFAGPLTIYGILSGFEAGQSVLYERVWTMMWLIIGFVAGLMLG
ncbi:hypothetical protein LY78DRAFT_544370, partial [Colletotrichum sublineola]